MPDPAESERVEPELRCSFCLRPRSEVADMVLSFLAAICDECLAECLQLIREQRQGQPWAVVRADGQRVPIDV